MSDEFKVLPYSIIVDTREQASFFFRDIKVDRRDGGGRYIVPITRKSLKTGDYAIEGFEDRCAVERKSMEDLFHCVGSDRERFENQLRRLNELEHPFVVVEASWERIFRGCPRSQLKPKTVFRSVIAWQQGSEFENTHWWFLPSKRAAELATFRILDRFWKKNR